MRMSNYRQAFNYIEKTTGFSFMNLLPALNPYSMPTRHFHTIFHVKDLVEQISKKTFTDDRAMNSYYYAALFHDIVYDPTRDDNEARSAEKAREFFNAGWSPLVDIELACRLIMGTKILDDRNESIGVRMFNQMDRSILTKSVDRLVEYGDQIWKEYSHVSRGEFLNAHFEIIRKMLDVNFGDTSDFDRYLENLEAYENIARAKKIRVGVYAGSFKPFHIGHMDILTQSERLFDKVIVAVGVNPSKSQNSVQQFINAYSNHKIQGVPRRFQQLKFQGLLADFAYALEKDNGYDVTVVRGFRDEHDIRSELTQRKYSLDANEYLKYVFLTSKPGLEHVSSTAIRHLKELGAEHGFEKYTVPPTWNESEL